MLGNTKPGTGCVDAPQCFGIKLDMAFKKFGATIAVYDKHLRIRINESVDFVGTDHVDDIKIACNDRVFSEFIQTFEHVFGNRDFGITRDNLTNCGIQHVLTPAGYELSKVEYRFPH